MEGRGITPGFRPSHGTTILRSSLVRSASGSHRHVDTWRPSKPGRSFGLYPARHGCCLLRPSVPAAIAPELFMQGAPVDSERRGRRALVAPRALQRGLHQLVLRGRHRFVERLTVIERGAIGPVTLVSWRE